MLKQRPCKCLHSQTTFAPTLMTNTSLQKIESIWNEFRTTPFPESVGSSTLLDELDFEQIDTFAAGCICTFIHSAGRLDQPRYDCLKTCLKDLTLVIKDLDDGHLKTRAEQLQFLSKLVLEYLDRKAGKAELS